MRRPFLLFIVAMALTGKVSAQQAAPPPAGPQITPDEWQELRAARTAALQANPDLMTERTKLMERMKALQDKVDAAMIKADPTMAPIIARFEAGRQRPGMTVPNPTAAPPPAK